LYSHVLQYQYSGSPGIFGEPGFLPFTVSASNPYNPFGTTVAVSDLFTTLPPFGQITDTNFFRPLVGGRGQLSGAEVPPDLVPIGA
jgi:hypothetical protein